MFDPEIIEQVWAKGKQIDGVNPNLWRQDFAGAWIRRDLFDRTTEYGWTISLVIPESEGGSTNIKNLLPLHWQNDRKKGNSYPEFVTVVTSRNGANIEREQRWQITNPK